MCSIQPGATESELGSHIKDPDMLAGGKYAFPRKLIRPTALDHDFSIVGKRQPILPFLVVS